MLIITNHHGNENQNLEMLPHLSKWLLLKSQVVVRIWRKENPPALWLEIQISTAAVANGMEVPQKIKDRITLSRNSTTGFYQVKMKTHIQSKEHLYTLQSLQ